MIDVSVSTEASSEALTWAGSVAKLPFMIVDGAQLPQGSETEGMDPGWQLAGDHLPSVSC